MQFTRATKKTTLIIVLTIIFWFATSFGIYWFIGFTGHTQSSNPDLVLAMIPLLEAMTWILPLVRWYLFFNILIWGIGMLRQRDFSTRRVLVWLILASILFGGYAYGKSLDNRFPKPYQFFYTTTYRLFLDLNARGKTCGGCVDSSTVPDFSDF